MLILHSLSVEHVLFPSFLFVCVNYITPVADEIPRKNNN
jgi:hypothetical protein